MNAGYVSGINEQQIVAVINKITSNIEKLESRFEQIDSIISNTNAHYNAESADVFRKRYNDFRLNYDVIKTNLLSYVEDLTHLIIKYKKLETNVADMVNTFSPSGDK